MVGYSLGHLVGSPVVNYLIQMYGWRGSHLIMSAVFAHVVAISGTLWLPEDRYRKKKRVQQCSESEEENECVDDAKETHQLEDTVIRLAANGGTADVKKELVSTELNQEYEITNHASQNDTQSIHSGQPKTSSAVKVFCKDIFNFSHQKDAKLLLFCLGAGLVRYNMRTFVELGPSQTVSIGLTKADAALFLSIFSLVAISMRLASTVLANLRKMNRLFYFAFGAACGAIGSMLIVVQSYAFRVLSSILVGMQMGK